MKVPYSWLKEFVDIDVTPLELADKLVKAGFEIEEIIDLRKQYVNIVVGLIEKLEPHPNANKLQICAINVGDKGMRQIVTGAKNVSVGDYVPVCLDGAVLPDGKEIHTGELRGVLSEGMLCGGSELDLNDADYEGAGFDGIFILNKAFDVSKLTLGEDINGVIDTDDVILDVSVTANRPDTNSIVGIAREVAAVLDKPFKPFAFAQYQEVGDVRDMVAVEVKDNVLCPRYMIKGVKDIVVKPSPVIIRRRLRKVGIRPINNIVDITNYVLIEVGQPMHAFDYKRLADKQIVVRRAAEGEHIVTLDGKDSVLGQENLVICNSTEPMALAGVMGGLNSGIEDGTDTILLESARFKRDNIRRTSKALGIRSDSSARFEKGIDFISQEYAIARAVQLIVEQGAGVPVGGVWDIFDGSTDDRTLSVKVDKINTILGISIEPREMVSILNRLQLKTTLNDGVLTVVVPQYREDIVNANDIAEEIIRIYGYDNIISTPLDGKKQTHGGVSDKVKWTGKIRQLLSGSAAYHEIISYSFISPKAWDMLKLEENDARRNCIKLLNPLGEELSVMRTTMLHSMLKTVALNETRANKSVKLYEIGKVYFPDQNAPSREEDVLMLSEAGEKCDFYSIRNTLFAIADKLNIKVDVSPKVYPYLHSGRSAAVMLDGQEIGYIGEVHPLVANEYRLDGRVYVAELQLKPLIDAATPFLPYEALPKYPAVNRDLAFVLRKDIPAKDILAVVSESAGDKLESVEIFDVYEGITLPIGSKSVAVALTFRDKERTLVDSQVVEAVDNILAAMKEKLNASLR
jgi:phenylalanyl-tRNA synthetase beta chain